jgi:hypothetical protein
MIMKYKSKFRFIQFFNEDDSEEKKILSLKNKIEEFPSNNKIQLVNYLNSGHLILFRPDVIFDLLSEKGEIIGSSSVYTDGTWLWNDYLIHYFEKYDLELPNEFISFAKMNNWVCPKITSEIEYKIVKEVFDFELNGESS